MKNIPARLHLLFAKEAPLVVVLRRKPTRMFHVMRWNTETDEIEHGSWFSGRIYEMESDLSFDGQHLLVYASGFPYSTWTDVCHPPFLEALFHWENHGQWNGGGLFEKKDKLLLFASHQDRELSEAIARLPEAFPFELGLLRNPGEIGTDVELYRRFTRDGFVRLGPLGREVQQNSSTNAECIDDPGWIQRPSEDVPALRVCYRGYSPNKPERFEWDVPDLPGLLDNKVAWAGYDVHHQLIVARLGVLYRYAPEDLLKGRPTKVIDLEHLEPPIKEKKTPE